MKLTFCLLPWHHYRKDLESIVKYNTNNITTSINLTTLRSKNKCRALIRENWPPLPRLSSYAIHPSLHNFNPFTTSKLSTPNFSLHNTQKVRHLVMRKRDWSNKANCWTLKVKLSQTCSMKSMGSNSENLTIQLGLKGLKCRISYIKYHLLNMCFLSSPWENPILAIQSKAPQEQVYQYLPTQ